MHSGVIQNVQQSSSQTAPIQSEQKPAISFTANRLQGEHKAVANQGTFAGSVSSVTQTIQPITSTQSFTQRTGQSSQQSQSSNVRSNSVSNFGQTTSYNNGASFGQKLSTNTAAASTTTVPYSPSVPPFRSTTTTTYTPTAASYNQRTQTYNGQSHASHSYTQHGSVQSAFSNNQFQVPAKEYLPSADNTRTARTNEFSFGNHGSTLKLTSSQNFARNGAHQQDGRQQFTYPVTDQVTDFCLNFVLWEDYEIQKKLHEN